MKQHPRHRDLRPGGRGKQRGERHRQADIVGQPLLEAELAGRVVADELEAPGAEDGRQSDREHDRGRLHFAAANGVHEGQPPERSTIAVERTPR